MIDKIVLGEEEPQDKDLIQWRNENEKGFEIEKHEKYEPI